MLDGQQMNVTSLLVATNETSLLAENMQFVWKKWPIQQMVLEKLIFHWSI